MADQSQSEIEGPRKKRPMLVYLACILVIYFFILPTKDKSRSAEQLAFDKWVGEVEKSYLLPADKGGLAAEERLKKVSIRLSGTSAQGDVSWKLDGSEQQSVPELVASAGAVRLDQQSKVLRILALIREANLFTPADNQAPGNIELSVNIGERTFKAPISEATISSNVQSQVMLRLFKEYSLEGQTKLAEKGDANAG